MDRQLMDDLAAIDRMVAERRIVAVSTCPVCFRRWRSDGDPAVDFAGPVVCPECLTLSVPAGRARAEVAARGR